MNRHEFEQAFLNTWSDSPEYPDGKYVARYTIDLYSIMREYPQHSDFWEYAKLSLKRQIFDKLGDQLLSGTPIVIRAEYVTWDRFDSYEKVIELRVQLQKAHTMNIVIPKWEPYEVDYGHKVQVKVLCSACGNVFHESERGACASCGAPANWSLK